MAIGDAGVALLAERGFECARLSCGVVQDGALAADLGVMMRDMFGAAGRDQPGQRLPGDAGERKIDNVRIAEEIIEKGLDRLWRIRSAELE